jgi:hypothetical protein
MKSFLETGQLARTDRLRPLADELGISMAQLALAWCSRRAERRERDHGVTRMSQLEDNVKASGLRLPAEILEQIDAIFPGPRRSRAALQDRAMVPTRGTRAWRGYGIERRRRLGEQALGLGAVGESGIGRRAELDQDAVRIGRVDRQHQP